MELAVHWRKAPSAEEASRTLDSLSALLGRHPRSSEDEHGGPLRIHRFYMGDEFCARRAFSSFPPDDFLRLAEKEGAELALLTPVLADPELEGAVPLLERLARERPRTEVVVNDWGVLSFLRENFPSFPLSAGRLLDKGFKDPRLPEALSLADISPEALQLLETSAFDDDAFRQLLRRMGVRRLERDFLPYAGKPPEPHPQWEASVYFPYGVVTTGRACWTAAFGASPSPPFVPGAPCSRPCRSWSLRLSHPSFRFRIFQNGNTVFYEYSSDMLKDLVVPFDEKEAGDFADAIRPPRLVYQGAALRLP